jgi:hypothetical protein
VLLNLLLMNPAPGYAHHSDAAYITTTIEFKNATITRVVWANPHGVIAFDVKDEKGQVAHWAVEMGSPSSMGTIGWTKNTVTSGEVVTIRLFPARNGAPLGRLSTITYPDGKVLNYRPAR